MLSGQMAIASFLAHAPKNFFPLLNGGDAVLLCRAPLLLIFFCFFVAAAAPGASTC
jgi:putative oxidoreductase